uniref:Solute carrier family 45 member 4b n=1 Tax=Mastacembelus armatus TaxID=205130 RepID=A0A3Q3LR55_9TELE
TLKIHFCLPAQYYSLTWFLSPILGLLFTPVIGSASDRCTLRWGRRRPFFLALCVGVLLGVALFLNGSLIGLSIGDRPSSQPIGIVVTVVGVVVLDFCADASEGPIRAYLLDVADTEEQDIALNIHACSAGLGGAVGYIVGGLDWTGTALGQAFKSQNQVLFLFAGTIFIISVTVRMLSIPEQTFTPSNQAEVTVGGEYTSQMPFSESDTEEGEMDFLGVEQVRCKGDSILAMPDLEDFFQAIKRQYWVLTSSWWCTFFLLSNVEKLMFLSLQPSFTFSYYGQVGSQCYRLRRTVASVPRPITTSRSLNDLSDLQKKFFFVFYHCTATLLLFLFLIVLFVQISMGIISMSISYCPYPLLGQYHEIKEYIHHSPANTRRGFGIDCAILSCQVYISQILVASALGTMVEAVGSVRVIPMVASGGSFLGFLTACFLVIYPDVERSSADQDLSLVDLSGDSEQNGKRTSDQKLPLLDLTDRETVNTSRLLYSFFQYLSNVKNICCYLVSC